MPVALVFTAKPRHIGKSHTEHLRLFIGRQQWRAHACLDKALLRDIAGLRDQRAVWICWHGKRRQCRDAQKRGGQN
ncbi:MAG: hypothetical protein Gyms2KO_02890 [Gymnodinialimonas sp.]